MVIRVRGDGIVGLGLGKVGLKIFMMFYLFSFGDEEVYVSFECLF